MQTSYFPNYRGLRMFDFIDCAFFEEFQVMQNGRG
jgi:hypothetical protein